MKTSIFAMAIALISGSALATEGGMYNPISTATFTLSVAGTMAGVEGGPNSVGGSKSVAMISNFNSASAFVHPSHGGITSGSEAFSVTKTFGANKSFGTGTGSYFTFGGGVAGASGQAGDQGLLGLGQ